jgi:hypothetical protein
MRYKYNFIHRLLQNIKWIKNNLSKTAFFPGKCNNKNEIVFVVGKLTSSNQCQLRFFHAQQNI